METEFIVMSALGFLVLIAGLHGTLYHIGHTSDKQFGQKHTEKLFTSLVMCVWGLSFIVGALFLNSIFG